MNALVGYTGFVGSNIYAKAAGKIEKVYNSKNIEESYGLNPDLLIYSGMRAEKYLANQSPDKDLELVYEAQENIKKINPKKLVLISTIDVYKEPNGKDESAKPDINGLQPYGLNRLVLEQFVRDNYEDALIIRLPGLYGINIKKNFIYDFINVIPFMLKEEKFRELLRKAPILQEYYGKQSNGFFKCKNLSANEKEILKDLFRKLNFTALNFTDSRNVFQFYPLSRLWDDINKCLEENIRLFHPATEPVSAAEIYNYMTGEEFNNKILETPVYYDYKTKYADVFSGANGYLMNKPEVLEDIKQFVISQNGL